MAFQKRLKDEVSSISAGDYRINEQIRGISQVRLIAQGPNGENENLGVASLRDALNLAADRGMDLVEVSPQADPPVCRIMDFSKFLYDRSKKEREARKSQKTIEVKEIRLRPKTNEHHMGFKVRDARKWLGDGMKVKVRIKVKGPAIDYPQTGREQLNQIAGDLQRIATIEPMPPLDGNPTVHIQAPARDKA